MHRWLGWKGLWDIREPRSDGLMGWVDFFTSELGMEAVRGGTDLVVAAHRDRALGLPLA